VKSKRSLLIIVVCFLLVAVGIFLANSKKVDVTQDDASYSVVKYSSNPVINGIKVNFTDFTGVKELYVLTMHKGDIVNINYKSTGIKMAILDDKYNIVHNFNADVNNSYNLKSNNYGKYFIRIYGSDASGNFQLKLNTKSDAKIQESNFWGI
jgi:Flp pilus assembly protein TadG